MSLNLTNLENALWTDEWSTSINPVQATAYGHVATPEGLVLQMCSNVPYGGWLCKQVSPLYKQSQQITLAYTLAIDSATPLCAQVVETDMKLTDAEGWTYDGSLQFNIAERWMIHTGDPWKDTGIRIPLTPNKNTIVEIAYHLDYALKTLTYESITVDLESVGLNITLPAHKMGWAPNQIVTQIQQCNNNAKGGYSLRFPNIEYRMA